MKISNFNPITSSTDLSAGVSPAEAAARQQVVHAIRTLSEANIFGENRELTFNLDRASHRMVIRVIDRDTRETIMQLPSEYVLQLSASLQKDSNSENKGENRTLAFERY